MPSFDWLSDLHPLFAAQETWLDGTYNKPRAAQLLCPKEVPFAIASGAGLLAEHVRRFKFGPAVIQRLGQVTDHRGRSVFEESFLNHLQRLRLRAHIHAAPEGTLLLPGEPMATILAPELQIRLLESAIHLLIWDSTYWSSKAAAEQLEKGLTSEEETPHYPHFNFDKTGWKMRANYIGGGASFSSDDLETSGDWPGLTRLENTQGQAIAQIRRLFKGEIPLGDVWLSATQESQASVSHTHIQFIDGKTGQTTEIQMSRFQNLMQPVLVKGHPALNSPSLDYLRQRTWKQIEAFQPLDLGAYQRGWFVG